MSKLRFVYNYIDEKNITLDFADNELGSFDNKI